MNLVDTIKWARNFAMLLVQMWSHHEALWCFIFVSFLGFGTLTIFLSTVAAALTIVFKSKVLLIPELWKHLKESGIGFFVSFTDVYVVSIWILRMRVIWLHHIVVVCLLWSLWAYCVKKRENTSDQITIRSSFECDWLRRWRELSGPITRLS